MNKFRLITYSFSCLVMMSSFLYGHEGVEYPKKIRTILEVDVNLPVGIKRGQTLALEPFSLPPGEVDKLLLEAQNGYKNKKSDNSLFLKKIAGKAGEVKTVLVPESKEKIKYFTDGHIYETFTQLVECSFSGVDKKFQIRIESTKLGALLYETNVSQSWLMVRNVFDLGSVILVGGDRIFIPCSVCFNTSNGDRVVAPFRSYDVGKDNDFFDGSTAWRWFGKNHLMAQLLITESKYGMNSIKEKRVYVFNVSSKELSLVDVESLIQKMPEVVDSKALDFDSEPLELIVLPVKVSKSDSEGINLLMRLKPAEER